jgi:uncharacterized protein YbjT (DUF2867 family)
MSESNILVTGGTGTLGRRVVARLRDKGRQVRVLSRKNPEGAEGVEFVVGDLVTGAGIQPAVQGIEVVVHCAGSNKGDDHTTRNLLRAASQAGVRHLVYISVVGADRVPVRSRVDRMMFGYFESKGAAERVVVESGLPWTTLRATQFYDLLLLVAKAMARLPVIPLPVGFRFQPIDADEVAARLVELAFAAPAGLVPDLGGPKIYTTAELIREYLRVTGRRRPIIPLWLPGRAARAVRQGAILAPNRAVGYRTWEEFSIASPLA